ncbi:hypothetical protein G6F50_017682 [Rhizopus delemar]|uniref:Uncharacterized protein n=1 Tax=Rhizopus delemar TaxID=936053 RepID=A0A9P6XPR6_9FUNG|nr:hypothetical protein G6F50_017682 [Rhizopus delemar]
MFWSSSWMPDVRRSVTTTAVVAAAPPTISGAQAVSERAAVDSAAASIRGRTAVLTSEIIRCLQAEERRCRRTVRAAAEYGLPGSAPCDRWEHIDGRPSA